MSVALSFQKVNKSFATNRVLRQFTLDVPQGESFVLLGRSGSGKSVLLKCLLGLLRIDQGKILMNGLSLQKESEAQYKKRMRQIGMVFQGSALFDSFSVWENVAFSLLHPPLRYKRKEAYAKALTVLKQVGLSKEVAHLFPANISGGMQRRVALARALILNPHFLFLDEPTAGLDPVFSRLIASLIQKAHQKLNATTFTITHDLALAEKISDRVGVLHEGRLVWHGPFAQMKKSKISAVTEFITG
ncbi:MAG: ATP-binding cassette domain-containing protein [Holosporaceae bacterium]